MYASDNQTIQVLSSKKSPYGLSDNEKLLSVIARCGTYANMKVSQAAFADTLFVVILQAAHGPHETKDMVPKLSRQTIKGFLVAEFQVICTSTMRCRILLIHIY